MIDQPDAFLKTGQGSARRAGFESAAGRVESVLCGLHGCRKLRDGRAEEESFISTRLPILRWIRAEDFDGFQAMAAQFEKVGCL